MKKVTSILLSAVIMLTAVIGFDYTALAGQYMTVQTARNYNIGDTISGYFDCDGDDADNVDMLKVELAKSGKVNLVCEGSGSYYVYIYTPDNFEVDVDYAYVGFDENLGKAYDNADFYLTAGTYYFKVYKSYYDSSNYKITSSFVSANESFPQSTTNNDNTISTANASLNFNTTYNGMMGANDGVDFYKFKVDIYDEYTFNMTIDKTSLFYSIYTGEGKEVAGEFYAEVDDNVGTGSSSKKVTLEPGTYYLKVRSNGVCFYSFSVNMPHQHEYDTYLYTVDPTYFEEGYSVYQCACGDILEDEYTEVKQLSKGSLKSVRSTKKNHSIKATWKKVKAASGYQVQFSTNKSFKNATKKTVKGQSKTSLTAKKFKKGKKYYVRVRAYKYSSTYGYKVYGKWSSAKTIKCK